MSKQRELINQKTVESLKGLKNLDEHLFYGIKLNQEQRSFINAVWSEKNLVVICNARAGTGKTLLSVGVGNLLVQSGRYKKIYYIMSPTQEQIQGYLPGDQEQKSAVYSEPLIGALISLGLNPNKVMISSENLESQKSGEAYIEFLTHTYMRGINLEESVVIVDEAQNFYSDSLKKVLTRVHDSCKVIVIGHTGQVDIPKHPERTGFPGLIHLFKEKGQDFSEVCELKENHRGKVSLLADELE